MTLILGSLVVLGSVLGGYVLSHGALMALWQPYEALIIMGGATGGFIISNKASTVKAVFQSLPKVLKGSVYNRALYIDLLSLLYDIFDKSRKQGVMSIEADVDDPQSSEIFTRYPAVMAIQPLIDYITDYLRIVSVGNMAAHELEGLMDMEIETRLTELEEPAAAVSKIADGLPGFGIVAAVLGIVITMQALGGPPAEIGQHVAAALVGTFFGILMAYGFVGPFSNALEGMVQSELKAYECTKVSILATMSGMAPQMAIEFGRKVLFFEVRPSFEELNEHVKHR
jgi:chemotaxis protein MotA